MSADLTWMIIRNNSCFLVKGNGRCYSKEPNNLKARNSLRYSGLVQKKTVGVEPAKDGKGVVLVTRKNKTEATPGKSYTKVELKKGSRQTLQTISKTLGKTKYRRDLRMSAMRRACAILKSQKPVAVKKSFRKKKE